MNMGVHSIHDDLQELILLTSIVSPICLVRSASCRPCACKSKMNRIVLQLVRVSLRSINF